MGVRTCSPPATCGNADQADAATQKISTDRIVSTDPPYYDNIGYADLSDYFYVWLRRSLMPVFPDLFATLAVPKAEELVATPYRHGSKEKAETSLNNLALLLQAQGDLAAAWPLYERALAITEKALGPKHPETATILNNLALLLGPGATLWRRDRSMNALAIREKVLGPEHPDTA